MLAKAMTCAIVGLEEAEVEIAPWLPPFNIVGVPDTAIQQARERVRAAIRNSGFDFPTRRITVNLAPADLKKAAPCYDLSVAIGILSSSGQVSTDISNAVFLGELSLDGSRRHTNGILPMVGLAEGEEMSQVYVPRVDSKEASLLEEITVYLSNSLGELVAHVRGETAITPYDRLTNENLAGEPMWAGGDLAYVRGQEHAKKTMGVAAAEGHNLLMSGPPGSGETFLACSLLSILPTMSSSESLKLTEIYSVAGLLPSDTPLIMHRPFRAWHYTISHAGLVRGGRLPHPGEVTLSYRRVLLLDELPEFGHIVLEVLRKPLEDRAVTISQAQGSVTFPANFMLVAAMNPCYCSYYGDPKKRCTCSYSMVTKYRKRISGPLLDCIDIFVEVPRVEYNDLTGEALGEESSVVRQRVGKASERQRQRFVGTGIRSNADMGPAEVREHCKPDNAAQGLAKAAMEQLHLSARAFHRTLKLSRTIADLADAEEIGVAHVAEAVQYRPKRQG